MAFVALAMAWFQSTLPYGERRALAVLFECLDEFQSTLPYGERHKPQMTMWQLIEFQSTLPYGERRREIAKKLGVKIVSIHAPVWGATCSGILTFMVIEVSIHAPVWGAT